MKTLTREQVRSVDRMAVEDFHIPSIILMENAGRGATEVLVRLGIRGEVIVLCGCGNNAGDGLVVARHLDRQAFPVRVVCATDPTEWQGDTATNYRIASASKIPICPFADVDTISDELKQADWIVDALLGTGTRGAPRSPLDDMIRRANDTNTKRLALDLPSGLDCDTGEHSDPTFSADHTCTFVAAKPGLIAQGARQFVGQLHVVDIGVPRILVERIDDLSAGKPGDRL